MDTCGPKAGRTSIVKVIWTAAVVLLLVGCGRSEDVSMEFGPYINLDLQPRLLADDFNAYADQVRLVFIVGPT